MENKEIVQLLINSLKDQDIWFTTKNDPTYEEASSYYALDEYGCPTELSEEKIAKEVTDYIGDGAVTVEDAIEMWINNNLMEYKLDYNTNLVTKFKNKPVVDQIGACENSVQFSDIANLNEDYKRRVQEENSKSANLISQMFQDKDFDSDSKEGQIVMRTSQLFNALSSKGYDVQVSFDNGESQSAILLGQQGGKVLVTITNTDQPLRLFASGNFEITDDNLKTLQDIQTEIEAI